MEAVSQATLERYLENSTLTEEQKSALRKEFKDSGGDRQVLNKAVSLNGRKSMTKVQSIPHK